MIIVWALLSSLLNRLRGGLRSDKIGWGTTVARLSTTGCMMLPVLLSRDWYIYIAAWLSLYVGFLFGWKAWQAMQTIPKDILSMSLRGLVLSIVPGLILQSFTVSLIGLTMGPIYYLGTFLPGPQDNVEWGEWVFGFALGLAIIIGA